MQGIDEKDMSNEDFEFGGKNTTDKNNYLILEAKGTGHYVGCHLDIHNLRLLINGTGMEKEMT